MHAALLDYDDGTLEALLRRDRLLVASSLCVITALAWAYVLWLSVDMGMGGMDMSGFRMIPAGLGMMAPATEPWSAVEFALVFLMWAVMMVGMMAPSAAPMVLMYARVARQRKSAGQPFAATGWFATGYMLAWVGFSLVATLVQWVLEREALLDASMASANISLGATVLIVAGIYQWTPLKSACLAQCQTPFRFLMSHGGFRTDASGCLRLGLLHGMYCVGCCWILMALLFVVGVMNVLWIAAGGARSSGEGRAVGAMDRPRRRRGVRRCGRLDGVRALAIQTSGLGSNGAFNTESRHAVRLL